MRAEFRRPVNAKALPRPEFRHLAVMVGALFTVPYVAMIAGAATKSFDVEAGVLVVGLTALCGWMLYFMKSPLSIGYMDVVFPDGTLPSLKIRTQAQDVSVDFITDEQGRFVWLDDEHKDLCLHCDNGRVMGGFERRCLVRELEKKLYLLDALSDRYGAPTTR